MGGNERERERECMGREGGERDEREREKGRAFSIRSLLVRLKRKSAKRGTERGVGRRTEGKEEENEREKRKSTHRG